jgi:hypothetical protein
MRVSAITGVWLALLCGCLDTSIEDVPEEPDLSDLAAAYEQPTAPLTPETVEAILDQLNSAVALTSDLDNLSFVVGGVIEPSVTHSEEDERPAIIDSANGFIRIRHICRGLDLDAPPDEELNGSLTLIARFTEVGVGRVVFGVALGCRYLIDGEEVVIDGLVRYDRIERLVSLISVVEVGDTVRVDGAFDFRVPPGSVEVRASLADDTHLILTVQTDGSAFGVRASNGTWSCDSTTLLCTDDDGNTVSLVGLVL